MADVPKGQSCKNCVKKNECERKKVAIWCIWYKQTGMCPAYTVRLQTEYLLWFYKKGNLLMPQKEARGKYPDIMTETVKRHSQKPVIAYEMLEDMFPDAKKLEMFARKERQNWDCWGNEV